jgi:hypothetical protein
MSANTNNSFYQSLGQVQQPVGVMVEDSSQTVPATSDIEPDDTATSVQNPEHVDTRDYQKAWKELKAHHDKTVYELREQVNELRTSQAQLTKPQVKAPKTPEEVKAFKEQYGEAYDIIETIVLHKLQDDSLYGEIKSKLGEVTKAQTELREKEAFTKLLELHPDAEQIKTDPRFEEWYNEQPNDIKRIFATGDYRSISKQLDLYKLEVFGVNPKAKKKAETKDRVDNSVGVDVKAQTVVNPQKKTWTGSEIAAITSNHRLWLKNRAEIDLARRENRVDWSK